MGSRQASGCCQPIHRSSITKQVPEVLCMVLLKHTGAGPLRARLARVGGGAVLVVGQGEERTRHAASLPRGVTSEGD